MKKVITISIVLLLLSLPWAGASALVLTEPSMPTHEDRLLVRYSPEPGDNITRVWLRHSADEVDQEDLDLTKDPKTGNYSVDLGIFPPGSEIRYDVYAWNRSVGGDNVSVASMVEMRWHDVIQGKDLHQELGRPMLVYYYSDDDKASYPMDTETFNDERVLNLSAEFVTIRVNVDQDPFTANETHVLETPSVLFLDERAGFFRGQDLHEEVHRLTGFRTAGKLIKHMNFALGKGPRPDETPEPLYPSVTHYLILMVVSFLAVVGLMYLLVRIRYRRH